MCDAIVERQNYYHITYKKCFIHCYVNFRGFFLSVSLMVIHMLYENFPDENDRKNGKVVELFEKSSIRIDNENKAITKNTFQKFIGFIK